MLFSQLRNAMPVGKNPLISVVSLPTTSLRLNTIGVTCGWGYFDRTQRIPNELQKATINVVSAANCQQANHLILHNEFCATAHDSYANMCGVSIMLIIFFFFFLVVIMFYNIKVDFGVYHNNKFMKFLG